MPYPDLIIRNRNERRLLKGHLWAFSNELMEVRKDIPAGTIVRLLREFDKNVEAFRAALPKASDEHLAKSWTLLSGGQGFLHHAARRGPPLHGAESHHSSSRTIGSLLSYE